MSYNSKKKYTFVFLIILIAVYSFGCNMSQKPDEVQSKFDSFTNELFLEEVQSDTLTLNYSLAEPEKYGIENKKTTLGDYTINQMKSDLSIAKSFLKKLKKFDYDALTVEQQLTYDIIKASLELDLNYGDYLYYTECLGPTSGIQAQLPILLAEYNFYSRDDIDTYLELLPCVYNYFEDIVEFEQIKSKKGLFMSDAVADKIIDQCEAFIADSDENFLIEYFNEKVANYEGLTSDEVNAYQEANKNSVLQYIIPSYELLIAGLKELKGTGINDAGLYFYPDGQSYYELLASSKTGSPKDLNDIADMLETAIGDSILTITQLSLSNPLILDEFEAFTSFPITDPEEIIFDLKADIAEDFPAPVKVNCNIKYVDDSLSEYLSPAMYLTPAVDEYMENNIYINGDDEDTLSKIYTTVAHEGYPGHLYQCVYFLAKDPDPVRNVMNFLGYGEGWATYVEMYSYSLAGIDQNLAKLMQVNNEVILFMYARADIGIHYEGWSKKKVLAYINNFVYNEELSTTIYDTLLEEPAVYLPYAVGYLEIKELRKKAENSLGNQFDPKSFHQFLLDIGPAQFGVINDRFDEWIGEYVAQN